MSLGREYVKAFRKACDEVWPVATEAELAEAADIAHLKFKEAHAALSEHRNSGRCQTGRENTIHAHSPALTAKADA